MIGEVLPEMVLVPARPPFRMGRTPVTNRQYTPFLEARGMPAPPWWSKPDFDAPDLPVVGVTWDEAMGFCAWLSESGEGRFRLPSEAEWEFAACGGLVAPRTAWGDRLPAGEVPEGPGQLQGPWPCGRGTPNGYGLCDMGTIVHEWCLDWQDPSKGRRASRGGSWRHEVRWSAPSARSSLPPGYRYSDYGFRVLCEGGLR